MGSFQQMTSHGTSSSVDSSPAGRSVSTGAGACDTGQLCLPEAVPGKPAHNQWAYFQMIRTILSSSALAALVDMPREMIENSAQVPVLFR
jgi:hypothetical protein